MNRLHQKIQQNGRRHGRRAGISAVVCAVCAALAPSTEAQNLRIVATTSDLASIAEAVAGEHAEVSGIADGKQDPHFLQAKPSTIMQARNADLWIRIGMDLEVGWEGPVLKGARNPRILPGQRGHLDASADVLRKEVPQERVTRAMGDVHPSGNPHYWLDPLNGRIVAETISERLVRLRPDQADAFRDNLAAFKRELDARMFGTKLVDKMGGDRLWAFTLKNTLEAELDQRGLDDAAGGWYGKLRPHAGKPILTHHRSWIYFADRFGLEIVGELEAKPGVPPGGRHLSEMAELAKKKKVHVILIEPFYTRKAAELVAARSAATVVVAANSVGGNDASADYLSMLDQVVDSLVDVWEEK
ncbi:MAG: metal ABC transporter substrate-binding protein [Verrucomicrobiota bacterium]